MKAMKLRFLLMGVIISGIGGVLISTRGFDALYEGFLGVGVILFILGLLWK